VKAHLIGINQGYMGLSEQLPIFLERVFELHSIDKGIKWGYCRMLLEENNTQTNWDLFMFNFTRVERTITTVQNMVENVLYYPDNQFFPCEDWFIRKFLQLVCVWEFLIWTTFMNKWTIPTEYYISWRVICYRSQGQYIGNNEN